MALRLRARPDPKRLERIGERWRPWRAAAARLLWAYYGAARAKAPDARPREDAGLDAKGGGVQARPRDWRTPWPRDWMDPA